MKMTLLFGRFFAFLFSITILQANNSKVDLIIYSHNRPMQLFALLESIEKYTKNTGQINVIYLTSNNFYAIAYDKIKLRFPEVQYLQQGRNPLADFRNLTITTINKSPNEYISFVVDDIIVTDFVNLAECVEILKSTGAYAFFLRLGKNITRCYTMNIETPPPPLTHVSPGIYTWKFCNGKGDWAYPNNNDFTIYRKKTVINDLLSIPKNKFTISYEQFWHEKADFNKNGLCFEKSKIVNICINVVYTLQPSLHQFSEQWLETSEMYTPNSLLKKFNMGLRIDFDNLYQIDNSAAHMEFVFKLKQMTGKNNEEFH